MTHYSLLIMIKLSPKLYIALLSLLLLLSLSSPALAAMPDLSGSWTVSEVISNNAVLSPESTSASLGLSSSTELLSLRLSPYGYGKMLFCGVVYPVELNAFGNGTYALTDSDNGFLLSLSPDGTLLCTLRSGLSLRLSPSGNEELPFPEGLPVAAALDEAAAARSLAASLRSSALSLSLPFSDADTTAMSNFMLRGRYWFDGTFLYGLAFDKNDILPNLVRMEVSFSDAAPQPGTCEPLDRHVDAVYLTPVDHWLYYIRHDRSSDTVSLSRLNLNTLNHEILISDHSELSCLHFHNNRLCFTAENHHFFSSDLSGKDLRPILEKEVYYPYFLDDDRLLYQDSADGETLHLFHCSDGTDIQITDTPSFHPILSGSSLYFLSAEDNTLRLSCMDLSSPSPDVDLPFPIVTSSLPFSQEFSITHSKLCYNGHKTDLALWSDVSDPPDKESSSYRLFHLADSFLVSAEMDDYGGRNVRALYLVDPLTGQEGVFPHVY